MFEALAGMDYRADIAIDDISMHFEDGEPFPYICFNVLLTLGPSYQRVLVPCITTDSLQAA